VEVTLCQRSRKRSAAEIVQDGKAKNTMGPIVEISRDDKGVDGVEEEEEEVGHGTMLEGSSTVGEIEAVLLEVAIRVAADGVVITSTTSKNVPRQTAMYHL
jgi:hypothetical protein